MTSVNELSFGFNKRIKINFDGDDLTSDAGLLFFKSVVKNHRL
ncbi:transposase [Sporosarcina limicola]|uniref:Transposase DDE domain-containing protein n=1 Tax=Sporosarcina limicola TaxID=34101 RepID=A0A927RE87_9BACL|nr:transposase [Sporosarcina limicola]MBE1554372.1 hypothetical protein [Sporosarcina limicola]